MVTNFADGLLGVRNKIKKNLDQLVGIADDGWQIGTRREVHFHLVPAERVFMELQGPFDNCAEIDRLLLRRGWSRKFQQILYDPRSASRLPVRQVQLALHGIVEPFALAHQFRDAQNRRQRIIQFVSHSGEHLSHCRQLFGLN